MTSFYRSQICLAAGLLALLIALAIPVRPLAAQSSPTSLWVPDNSVSTMLVHGSNLFIAGAFTAVGQPTGSFVALHAQTGLADPSMPIIDGITNSVIEDGTGGWYLGGDFTMVNGEPRTGLAHIRADKTLDPTWKPTLGNPPPILMPGHARSLSKVGTRIYVYGMFGRVNGTDVSDYVVLDATTGAIVPGIWPEQRVQPDYISLSQHGDLLYGFRWGFLDAYRSSDLRLLWSIPVDNGLSVETSRDGRVYIVGAFRSIGGQSRQGIAALDAASGQVLDWYPTPEATGQINALALSPDGQTAYLGGKFSTINGQPRASLAAVDTVTGQLLPWNPGVDGPDSYVYSLTAGNEVLYIGGSFPDIGGQERSNLAAVDLVTGTVSRWNPRINGRVMGLRFNDGIVYSRGEFSSVGTVARQGLAALDLITGAAKSWNPAINGDVNAMTVVSDTLYIGGQFTNVGGQPRRNLAALDIATGVVQPWNPVVEGESARIHAMAVVSDTLYIGGYFTSVNGQSRQSLAALDRTSGALHPLNLPLEGSTEHVFKVVEAMVTDGNILYIGGSFTGIAGNERYHLAAINLQNSTLTDWQPRVGHLYVDDRNALVFTLLLDGDTVYVGGDFGEIDGQAGRVVAIDKESGAVRVWPKAQVIGMSIRALAKHGDILYVGGNFYKVGEVEQRHLAAINTRTGRALPWQPNPNDQVTALTIANDTIYAGGRFTSLSEGTGQRGVAALNLARQYDFFLPLVWQ